MSIIDTFYNFVNSESSFLKKHEDSELLEFFLQKNMIVYDMITTVISIEVFKKNVSSYQKLSTILEKELNDYEIDEEKIDICKQKLKKLLTFIYKYDTKKSKKDESDSGSDESKDNDSKSESDESDSDEREEEESDRDESKEEDEKVKMATKVKGLYYKPNVIDKEYTKELVLFLDKSGEWKPVSSKFLKSGEESKGRKVQHYGYKYDYKTGSIYEKTNPIPKEFEPLIKSLKDICKSLHILPKGYVFNQVIVNNYDSGQGISSHTDVKDYGDVIGCYTIGSGGIMRFKKGSEQHDITRVHDIYVEPKSLYIMSGDSRKVWKHEMLSRKSDIVNGVKIARGRRISLTFRNVPVTSEDSKDSD